MPMPKKPELEGMSVIVPVSDMSASVAFYRDILGFELRYLREDNQFALLARDHAAVSLGRNAPGNPADTAAYVWVDDVDALYEELRPGLESLPEGRLRKPFNQHYGMREFHVLDSNGALWFFGMNVD